VAMLIASTVNTSVHVFMFFPPCCQTPALAPGLIRLSRLYGARSDSSKT
jgi:hypothetical protein